MKYRILTASENSAKIEAVKTAFSKVFPNMDMEHASAAVLSHVADQPLSSEETYKGAKNRAENARKRFPDFDFWVGIEGGTEKNCGGTESFAWVCIISKSAVSKARTAGFYLPQKVADLLHKGYELGNVFDRLFSFKNSKKEQGAVGILTNNIITRAEYYTDAVVFALIPFINKELY